MTLAHTRSPLRHPTRLAPSPSDLLSCAMLYTAALHGLNAY